MVLFYKVIFTYTSKHKFVVLHFRKTHLGSMIKIAQQNNPQETEIPLNNGRKTTVIINNNSKFKSDCLEIKKNSCCSLALFIILQSELFKKFLQSMLYIKVFSYTTQFFFFFSPFFSFVIICDDIIDMNLFYFHRYSWYFRKWSCFSYFLEVSCTGHSNNPLAGQSRWF